MTNAKAVEDGKYKTGDMEKARSYRMKSDALSHQGKTLGQNVPKSDDNRTTAKIGADNGESYKTVQRYIRLTYLAPELQEYVDTGKMKMLPAVEISYLDEEGQRNIVDRIEETEVFPSHAQTRKMRALFEEGKLDYDIKRIFSVIIRLNNYLC